MASTSLNRWPHIFFFGTLWGISECLLGLYLRRCASLTSGSIMTGIAIFFLAASWSLSRNRLAIPLMVIIASLFKMFDALLLSLPMQHGAVANPIFAFLLEGMAMWIAVSYMSEYGKEKILGQVTSGIFAALLAVNLFPLVKYVTGIPACVVPGSNFPLSLYYAPLAILISAFSFPLGFYVGRMVAARANVPRRLLAPLWLNRFSGVGVLLLGLIILAVSRGTLKF